MIRGKSRNKTLNCCAAHFGWTSKGPLGEPFFMVFWILQSFRRLVLSESGLIQNCEVTVFAPHRFVQIVGSQIIEWDACNFKQTLGYVFRVDF